MNAWGLVIILIVACDVSAYSYTGVCFLDALLQGLDTISTSIGNAVHPTTTTTTSSTSTTSTTDTTSTTTTDTIPSTTTSTTSTTTTTLYPGKCGSETDCPENSATYTCDQDNNILILSTSFTCRNAGTPQSECIGHTVNRIDRPCNNIGKCVKGLDYCVKA